MDVIANRHNDVQFIISKLSWEEIPEYIRFVFEEENNDYLLRIYLSNPFQQQTFKDFKEKALEKARMQIMPQEIRDAHAKLKALEIEQWFKERGGGNTE